MRRAGRRARSSRASLAPAVTASLGALAALFGSRTPARAQDAPARAATPPSTTRATTATNAGTSAGTGPGVVVLPNGARLTLGGYVEAFYQLNLNLPANGITNFRGFDNRHNSFTLNNVVVEFGAAYGPVSARIAAQVGHTPESYYLAEPVSPGASGAGASSASVWKYLQQANVAWRAPLGPRGLLVEAGLFLSPIGVEGFAIKDQWNWSRSNLFYGLPFYHTGVRATYPLTDACSVSAAVFNGWNSVVDNNDEKSVVAAFGCSVADRVAFNALYFGGVERAPGAAEGRAWRHMLDSWLTVYVTPRLALQVQANAGLEPNALGTAGWATGALYARAQLGSWIYVAARGDAFFEAVPGDPRAGPIFWARSPWVASGTATLGINPAEHVALRLEYRHDHAGAPLFFSSHPPVAPDGSPTPDALFQDTITVGATAWF